MDSETRRRSSSFSVIFTLTCCPIESSSSGDSTRWTGDLGYVHQPFDSVGYRNEGAERHRLGHDAVDHVADFVLAGEVIPRILARLPDGQRDPLPIAVDLEHLDLHLVPYLDQLAGVIDVLPRELGDVDQTVHPAEVDEGAEIDD